MNVLYVAVELPHFVQQKRAKILHGIDMVDVGECARLNRQLADVSLQKFERHDPEPGAGLERDFVGILLDRFDTRNDVRGLGARRAAKILQNLDEC